MVDGVGRPVAIGATMPISMEHCPSREGWHRRTIGNTDESPEPHDGRHRNLNSRGMEDRCIFSFGDDVGPIAQEKHHGPSGGQQLEWFIRCVQEENLLHLLNLPSHPPHSREPSRHSQDLMR